MKRLLLTLIVPLVVLPGIAQAQFPVGTKLRPAKAAERQAAITAIRSQLNAFKRDDYKTAIQYQSAGLKRTFPTLDAFRTMMVRTYPEFAHSKAATFGPAQTDTSGIHLAILASVTGQDGITVRAVYLMVREGKAYHVEGVAGGAQMPPDLSGPSKDV